MQAAVLLDVNNLSRRQVAYVGEALDIERDAFRCHHVLGPAVDITLPQYQGPDAVRIAKSHDPVIDDDGNGGISAAAPFVD